MAKWPEIPDTTAEVERLRVELEQARKERNQAREDARWWQKEADLWMCKFGEAASERNDLAVRLQGLQNKTGDKND